jgi:hypothetical protein
LAVLAVGAEAVSYFAYWAVDGRPFSYARAQRRRCHLLAEEGDAAPTTLRPPPMADVHPYLGFAYNPEFRGAMLPGEDAASDWGFTDKANRPPVRRRSPDKVIVGILGASVASLFAAQGAEALARELKRSPRFAGKEIEFVNLAVGSFKQPQQLMAFNYALAMGAEFDVVINLDGLNEVAWYAHENGPRGISRLYPLSWHWFVPPGRDLWSGAAAARAAEARGARRRWAARFERVPFRYSVAANLVWRLRDGRLAAEAAAADGGHLEGGQLPYPARGPGDHFHNDEEALEQLAADWERCSLLIHQLCAARGARYYHFLQPNQYVPGSKPLSAEERQGAYSEGHPSRPLIEKGYPLLRAGGRRLAGRGVCFRDLSLAYAHSGETFYFDNCCHINRAGAEALATPIARAILETGEPPLAPAEGGGRVAR